MSENKIRIKLHYFAKIKEIMKKQCDEILVDKKTIKAMEIFQFAINENKSHCNELKEIFDSCLISLNDEYVDIEQVITIKNGDEFSILPPISAG